MVNYVLSKLSGSPSETKMALELAEKALAEMGQTSRHAMDVVQRIANNQRPAARLFVVPVGQSCARVTLGDRNDGAIPIDKPRRDSIDAPEPIEIGETGRFSILLSELDLKNRTCKFSILGEPEADSEDRRINGDITDPMLHAANNPYSLALANQRPLEVAAKPQLKDGQIEKLYISDVGTQTALLA